MVLLSGKIKYLSLIFIALLTVSCAVEDGTDGMNGLDGADGIDGLPGPAGPSGVSNVTTVLFENQELASGEIEFDVPELTQDIFDKGLVYGYFSQNTTQWVSLPFSSLQNLGTEEEPILASLTLLEVFRIEVGKIVVFSLLEPEAPVDIRFVLVQGNAALNVDDFTANDFIK